MLRNQQRQRPGLSIWPSVLFLFFWPGHFCHALVVLKTAAAGKHWEKIKTREDNPSLEACPENPPLLLLSSPSSLSAFSEHDHNLMPKRPLRSSPHWRRLSSDWLTAVQFKVWTAALLLFSPLYDLSFFLSGFTAVQQLLQLVSALILVFLVTHRFAKR